ncbi:hypothetical protein KJ682_16510 [bacterium]|nr:hypothetical protein [bacterium]
MKSANQGPGGPEGPGAGEADALPQSLTVGEGRTAVDLVLRRVGRDLLLTVTGGEAHAGAVALCWPDGQGGVACADLAAGIHKEGPLARECAGVIAAAAGCTCAVVAGIHQDRATRDEITTIVANAAEGARRLAALLTGCGPEEGTHD